MYADDLIGRKVANDGVELRQALEECFQVTGVSHIANFSFLVDRADGPQLYVATEPVDLAMRKLRITDIREIS